MRFCWRCDRSGQSVVEYMLFMTALVTVFIGFTLKTGLMREKVEKTLDSPTYMLQVLDSRHTFSGIHEN